MQRRSFVLPALLLATAIAAGACGGSTPSLSDPREILTKAVAAMQKAKTVHLDATVDGTVNLDLLGTGQANGLALTGTSLTADIDIEAGNLRLDLAVPAMLGLTAELIAVDGATYTKTSFTGEKFTKSDDTSADVPVDLDDPQASLKELEDWLAKPDVDPKKLADAACGSKTCYQVEIDLSPEDIAALMPDAEDIGDASVVLTILVDKGTLLPASVDASVSSAELGDVTASLDLSNWDAILDIVAPPADQVE
ncbi:MAG TPA: hypothetical protein VLS28_00670 [Candidatus Sulfomarinibacteraceae bacterium]|nr:hypothetical protein [Candidatus Sulfomarinibacteraceae bacterium]